MYLYLFTSTALKFICTVCSTVKSLHFQCDKFILIQHIFYMLLTNEHSLIYNQNDCFAFFFETYIKAAILVLHF